MKNFNKTNTSLDSKEDKKNNVGFGTIITGFFIDSMREVLILVNRISVILSFNNILKIIIYFAINKKKIPN